MSLRGLRTIFGILVGGLTVFTTAATAEERDLKLTIENQTGSPVVALESKPSSGTNWQVFNDPDTRVQYAANPNRERIIIAANDTGRLLYGSIDLALTGCNYDVSLKFGTGKIYRMKNIDLCSVSRVVFASSGEIYYADGNGQRIGDWGETRNTQAAQQSPVSGSGTTSPIVGWLFIGGVCVLVFWRLSRRRKLIAAAPERKTTHRGSMGGEMLAALLIGGVIVWIINTWPTSQGHLDSCITANREAARGSMMFSEPLFHANNVFPERRVGWSQLSDRM
jgi:hypothetical protein